MKTIHILVMAAAIFLPGAFVILFIALAKKYYRKKLEAGKEVPAGITKILT